MTYLINILDIIKSSIGYYPIQWILLTINILLFFTVKVLYQYEYNGIDYKIYNHLFNKVNNIIYIIVFLLILLYLRYLRWGYTIELIPLFEKWLQLWKAVPFLIGFGLIQIIIIGILLLGLLRKYLLRELWKRHLYFYYTSYNNTLKRLLKQNINPLTNWIENEYSLYNRVVNKLSGKWSYQRVLFCVEHFCILKPYSTFTHGKEVPWVLISVTNLFFKGWIYIMLFGIIFYDLYYHNYTFHYIFYFLPFYLLYSLWKSTSNFLVSTSSSMNFIIYERYYEMDNVLYVNTTDEEEEIFIKYIKCNFRCYLKDLHPINNQKEWDFMVNFPTIFKQQHRFVKNPEGIMFENETLGASFDPKTITIRDM